MNEAVNEGPLRYGRGAYLCNDGGVLVQTDPNAPEVYFCLPFDVGVLFAKNGGADRVRYADYHLWTGDAIAEPTSCPSISNVPICGGHCGGCPQGDVCTGRSPQHPYGVCLQDLNPSCKRHGPTCKKAGMGCFLYAVEPAAQALADDNGYCLPIEQCQAMATSWPGGGTCTPAKN